MDIGRFTLRTAVGALFVGHGTQKLFGWFGGHGIEGTAGFFESLGLRPGRHQATAAGVAEAAGGALLVLGLLTPLAASTIAATMVTAMRKVSLQNGLWATDGGIEYSLVLLAAMAVLADDGPGALSLDGRLFPNLRGPGWAALTLAAGGAGSALATSAWLGEKLAPGEREGAPTTGGQASNGDQRDAEQVAATGVGE